MVARRFDVEAVLVHEAAAERGTDGHEQRDDDGQDGDADRRHELGVVVVQTPRDVGEREHRDGNHDRRVRVDRAASLRSCFRRLPRVPQAGQCGEDRHDRAGDERVRAGVPELPRKGAVFSADHRDHVEHAAEHICSDRKVGERRM